MHKDVHYTIREDSNGKNRIVRIDKENTGVFQYNMHMNNGVHPIFRYKTFTRISS